MSNCMCGAEDCPQCYPGNFHRGQYLSQMCRKCECDFWLEDSNDESTLCEDCRKEDEDADN